QLTSVASIASLCTSSTRQLSSPASPHPYLFTGRLAPSSKTPCHARGPLDVPLATCRASGGRLATEEPSLVPALLCPVSRSTFPVSVLDSLAATREGHHQ